MMIGTYQLVRKLGDSQIVNNCEHNQESSDS